MITDDKITEIFCLADDFCKLYERMLKKYSLEAPKSSKRKYHCDGKMNVAEIIVIMIMFHSSNNRCLKHFYIDCICKRYRHLFPKTVSYTRFVELQKIAAIPLAVFIKKVLLGKCTGISFVDSTSLRVCRNQRIHMHKFFKGIAERGKCSMGWFFGFKLYLICNEKGELLNFMFTPGDVDDRKPLEYEKLRKGYLWQACRRQGLHQQEIVRPSVWKRDTANNQTKKQYERCYDERI